MHKLCIFTGSLALLIALDGAIAAVIHVASGWPLLWSWVALALVLPTAVKKEAPDFPSVPKEQLKGVQDAFMGAAYVWFMGRRVIVAALLVSHIAGS